jgi:hypothetical protein
VPRAGSTAPLRAGAAILLAALAALACWGSGTAEAAPASVAEPCAHAKALYSAGYYAAAAAEYKRLLGIAGCAEEEPAKRARAAAQTQAEKPDPKEQIEQAERLQAAGFEAQARELVKAVAQGSTEAIPQKLRSPTQRIGWWRNLLGKLGPAVRTALEALAVLAGVIVAILLVFTGLNALRLRFKRSAQLTGFTGAGEATLPPVLGAALSSMLASMTDNDAVGKVDWQSGTEPKFEIPVPVAEVVPQAKLLAGLIQMLDGLLFRKLVIVSGTVHPVHEHRGAGITLVVTNRSGREVEQITVWEHDFALKEAGDKTTDAVRYERLILPAAVWLAYCPMLGAKPKDEPLEDAPLHVRDWRSYALFALGELVPYPAKQQWLYEKALDRDSGNLGARLNLAALLLRRPELDVPEEGNDAALRNGDRTGWKECLDEAGRHLECVARNTSPIKDPIWYRARYMQAIRLLYLDRGADALTILACLQQEISDQGKEPRKPALRRRKRTPHLGTLLNALEQPVAILKLSAELTKNKSVKDLTGLPDGWLTATAEYNLACFWARYAGLAGSDQDERGKRTFEAVSSLRRAIERNAEAVDEARIDPALDSIRDSDGFKAVMEQRTDPEQDEPKPSRYAITLDPGPELLALTGRSPSP